jgi:uncharacterized phage-associated protein
MCIASVEASASSTAAVTTVVSSFSSPEQVYEPEAFMSSLSACDILQQLFEESSSDDTEELNQKLDKIKAQKLLYYAQGYYLALYGKRIFAESIEAWDLGPAVRELHESWKHRDLPNHVLPSDFFKKARKTSDKDAVTVREIRFCLRNIHDMFLNYSSNALIAKTHKEKPWSDAYAKFLARKASGVQCPDKSDEKISLDDLQRFFRKPEQLISYIQTYVRTNNSESSKVQRLVQQVRSVVSMYYTLPVDIDRLYEALLDPVNSSVITQVYDCCKDDLAWNRLDKLDCVVNYIFLPVQCEQLYDTRSIFLHFGHLRYLLAISARHHHPLAHAYLNTILASYAPQSDQESDSDEEVNQWRYISHSAKAMVEKYLHEDLASNAIYPPLYVGLLRKKFGKAAYSEAIFHEGAQKGNALCLVHSILGTRDLEWYKNNAFINRLSQYNDGLIPFIHAELSSDQTTRLRCYIEAGDKGIFDGYLLAGLLVQVLPAGTCAYQAKDLFLKAAQGNVYAAYEHALKIAIGEQDQKLAVSLCEELRDKGSTQGFALVAKAASRDTAQSCLDTAGVLEAYPMAQRFAANKQEYEKTYREAIAREYHTIRREANYEQLPAEEI